MDDDVPPLERIEVVGDDVDQARQMFETAFNGQRFVVEPVDAPFAYRYTSVGDDELSLRGNRFAGRVRGTVRTTGEYVVSWTTSGDGVTDLFGDPMRMLAGRPAMFVTGRPAAFEFSDFRHNLMHFDAAFLERVASDHEGSEGPLLFDTTARPDGDDLARWASSVASVARVIHDAGSPPLLRREANRRAAIALLDAFPHTAFRPRDGSIRPNAAKVRDAIEYMYANAQYPLRAEEIAEVAGLSVRTLQTAFRRDFDTTPLEYLRRIRLDHVRWQLQSGEPTTVAETAHRWGFAHLGRFAAAYAERFGEHPRTTLYG